MASLKQDIVWFVERTYSEPDPSGRVGRDGKVNMISRTVLVPQVYAISRPTDVVDKNAVISAASLLGALQGKVNNSGALSATNLNLLQAEALENSGAINGRYVDIRTRGEVNNIGGRIEADKGLLVKAGGDIRISSRLKERRIGETQKRQIDKVASVKVRDADGVLQLSSDKDIRFNAAQVESGGGLHVKAKGALRIDSLNEREQTYSGGGDNFRRVRKERDVGSVLQAQGDMALIGEQSVYAKAAQISSANGRVQVASKGDVTITAGLAVDEEESKSKSKKRRRLGTSKKTTETYHYRYDETALSSVITGPSVSVMGRNVDVKASHVWGKEDVLIQGKGRVTIEGGLEEHRQAYAHSVKKSGLSSRIKHGIVDVNLGQRKQGGDSKGSEQQVAVSSVNAARGNVVIKANEALSINGSNVTAGKDIALAGSEIKLGAMYSHGEHAQHHYAKSSGIGVSVSLIPLLAGWQAAKDHYKANQRSGKSVLGKITTLSDAGYEGIERSLKPVTFAVGTKSQSSQQQSSTDNAAVSQLQAGGNVRLYATAGGIVSEGADIRAEGDFSALAKGDIVWGTAKQQRHAEAREKAWGVGIDTAKSWMKEFGAYRNKATEDSGASLQKVSSLSVGGSSLMKSEAGSIVTKGTDMAVSGDNHFMAHGDVIFGSTLESVSQNRHGKGKGIGSVEISDTERFTGYYQNKESGYLNQTTHKGSVIGSEKGNIQIYAGGKYIQESSALLANDGKVAISAKSVESIAHDNVSLSGNRSSDTKIGQFSKVSSPLLDLVNIATSAKDGLEDDKAGGRLKALRATALAVQGYSTVQDLAQGVLARAETGIGIKHAHADYHEQAIQGRGNLINGARGVEVTAREGKIDFKQIDITTTQYNPDTKLNEVTAGSYVYLDGKQGINLRSGRDEFHAQGRQVNYGAVVGGGAQVGAGTGFYLYAELGFTDGKQRQDSHRKQNSHIATERLMMKSGGDVNMKGASAYAERIDADIKGKLHIESEQSTAQSRSSTTGASARVQISLGTAWGANGSFSSNKGASNHNGVVEQAGLFAGKGGYHIKADNVHLEGSAIASTNPNNSELATNRLTFADIRNDSAAKISAISFSGGVGSDETRHGDKGTATQQTQALQLSDKSLPIGIGLPLNSSSHNSTFTRATLTEGRITLNKDSQPIQTTASALGLNSELSQAHAQVEKADLDKLKESQEIAALSGQLGAFAVGEIGKRMQWEDGSWQKTALHAAVGAASAKLSGGNVAAGATAGAASEVINTYITEHLAKNTNLSPQARKSIQQLTATAIGAAAGNLIGGDTNRRLLE